MVHRIVRCGGMWIACASCGSFLHKPTDHYKESYVVVVKQSHSSGATLT